MVEGGCCRNWLRAAWCGRGRRWHRRRQRQQRRLLRAERSPIYASLEGNLGRRKELVTLTRKRTTFGKVDDSGSEDDERDKKEKWSNDPD